MAAQDKNAAGTMKWWQLSLLGVACTIGTGYFLGSGIAIKTGGASIVLLFVLAACGTYIVYDVLSRMTAADPRQGSFRAYAKMAFGRWAGFSGGWVYWSSEMLIMGSQLTALSLFTRLWLPGVPMWLLASGYAVLGATVIVLGTKAFESAENVFAVMKIAAILLFLVIAAAALLGYIQGKAPQPRLPLSFGALFPGGALGTWSSFIYAFYAFGGIEIMGFMAIRLKKPEEGPKAGKIMILLLTIIYIASLVAALTLVPPEQIHGKESPFQTALHSYSIPYVPHVFNAILIIAGFSTMVASLFAVTTILVALAEDGDAPAVFSHRTRGKRQIPLPAIGLTTLGIGSSVLMALLLPEELYEYITTAAGIMLLYNWLFILLSSGKLLELTTWGKTKRFLGMALILIAVGGTWFHPTSRPGFWISLLFIAVIAAVTCIVQIVRRKGNMIITVELAPERISRTRKRRSRERT